MWRKRDAGVVCLDVVYMFVGVGIVGIRVDWHCHISSGWGLVDRS